MIKVSFFLPAGLATVAPPIGPVLGQFGVNMSDFCSQFNDQTTFIKRACILPVIVEVLPDRSFKFNIKKPTISFLLKCSLNNNKNLVCKKWLLKEIFKISIIKSTKYSNKFFLSKMIYSTFLSLDIKLNS